MQRLDEKRRGIEYINKVVKLYGKLHPPSVLVHSGTLSSTLILDVGRPTTLERLFRDRMYLFPVSAANRNRSALLHICITFFDLAPPFDLESLSLRTPPASAGVIVLSMLVSNLKYRIV